MGYLALDWGLKKVGVATADPQGIVITPREVYFRPQSPQLWSLTAEDKSFIKKLLLDFEPKVIVVGNPLRAESTEKNLRAYSNFLKKLSDLTQLSIENEDESLSSWEASKVARPGEHDDSEAAAVILRSFLSRRQMK